MHKGRNQPRAGARRSARKLPRRAALKGFGAIAVAAVGCSSDPAESASPVTNSAGASPVTPPSSSTAGATAAGAKAPASAINASAAGASASTPGAGTSVAGAPGAGTSAASSGAQAQAGATAGSSAAAGSPAANGGAVATAGAGGAGAGTATSLDALQCVVTPAMTEGPFFIDEKLERSNLVMGETADAIVKARPLKLVIGVYEVTGMQCTPLSGVQVDIWHADALGVYSDVAAGVVQSVDTRGKKFLRGYQLSDEQGMVQFETIYPGWYMSRTIHIHFKLRTRASGRSAREFTSQMFFDEAISTEVLAQAPYSGHPGTRSVLNDDDHIYNGTARNGQKPPAGMTPPGKSITPTLVADGAGYTATLKVGLRA